MTWNLWWLMPAVPLLLAALLWAWGRWHWRRGSRRLQRQLARARTDASAAATPVMTEPGWEETLPAPVARYFATVLETGQPIVAAAEVQHTGHMRLGGPESKWVPFNSLQRVVTHRPGFVWDARLKWWPGCSVRVLDAYVAGVGRLRAALWGWLTVAKLTGGHAMAEGELMRYLAEAAWYPTALLPGQGVVWEAGGEHTARATLSDGLHSASLWFHFDEHGLIDLATAHDRGRMVKGVSVPTPWECRFSNYALRSGMRIPLDGEVAWLLPTGPQRYYRARIVALAYEWA